MDHIKSDVGTSYPPLKGYKTSFPLSRSLIHQRKEFCVEEVLRKGIGERRDNNPAHHTDPREC